MRQDFGVPHIGDQDLPPSIIFFECSVTDVSTEFAVPDYLGASGQMYVAMDKKDRRSRSDRRNGERRVRSRRQGDRRGTDRRGPDRRQRS